MIVLDTNVVSEVMEQPANFTVLEWFNSQVVDDLWITAISMAELLYGIDRLAEGRRKAALASALDRVTNHAFAGRVMAFDSAAARYYSILVAHRFAIGRPVSVQDAQIAAICSAHAATLATRNTRDFEETGIELINPWEA